MAVKAKSKAAGPRGAQVKENTKITIADQGKMIKLLQKNLNLKVEALTKAQRVARGVLTTATAADTVVTGLTTVVAVISDLSDDPVIGCDRSTATIGNQAGAPAAGSVIIKTWKPTSATDPTPVPAITFGKKVNWIAWGT